MRIISGQARGRRLKAPAGQQTRPTADRVKEAIFSVLESQMGGLQGQQVLDLFAGSGALGLEALSRGAAHATFVDRSVYCRRAIEENIQNLEMDERARVLKSDVFRALQQLAAEPKRFGLVLADPPYADDPSTLLEACAQQTIFEDQAVLMLEHGPKNSPVETYGRWSLFSKKRYGDTACSFYLYELETP